ncbi:MAG: hypothetical protein V4720_01230 [Pseudomonadota bacterium]
MSVKTSTLALVLMAGAASADCGPDAGACKIPGGTYHIVLPDGVTGPIPAILLLHGYGGEGLGTIRNKPMVNPMLGHGYAVIPPTGSRGRMARDRPGISTPTAPRPATRPRS